MDGIAVPTWSVPQSRRYSVEPSRLLKVASHVTSAGVNGVRQTIFAARVSAKDRQGGGGGGLDVDGEAIEVLAVPLSRLEEFLEDESLPKSAGLQFAGLWVLRKGVETLP